MHIDDPGQLCKNFQVKPGKVRHPEERHPPGQPTEAAGAAADGLDQPAALSDPVQPRREPRELMPDQGLPALMLRALEFPGLPAFDHLRPENKVLIEQVGDFPGQLVAFDAPRVVREEMLPEA